MNYKTSIWKPHQDVDLKIGRLYQAGIKPDCESQFWCVPHIGFVVYLGMQLIAKLKRNMKNKLISVMDKLPLRKRALVETVSDQLKNISQLEHSRHRSVFNFIINIVAAIIAYSHQPKKTSIGLMINTHAPVLV